MLPEKNRNPVNTHKTAFSGIYPETYAPHRRRQDGAGDDRQTQSKIQLSGPEIGNAGPDEADRVHEQPGGFGLVQGNTEPMHHRHQNNRRPHSAQSKDETQTESQGRKNVYVHLPNSDQAERLFLYSGPGLKHPTIFSRGPANPFTCSKPLCSRYP